MNMSSNVYAFSGVSISPWGPRELATDGPVFSGDFRQHAESPLPLNSGIFLKSYSEPPYHLRYVPFLSYFGLSGPAWNDQPLPTPQHDASTEQGRDVLPRCVDRYPTEAEPYAFLGTSVNSTKH